MGDIVFKGNNPSKCIELVKEKCEIVLQGNCDNFMSKDLDKNINYDDNFKYSRSLLSKKDINYLKTLPFSYEFKMGGNLIRLFHSTPNSQFDFIDINDSNENKYSLFLSSNKTISNKKADIIIQGHYHTADLDKLYNRIRIITGSVGNPVDNRRDNIKDVNIGQTIQANYIIIEGILNDDDDTGISYSFINVPYNINKELKNNTRKDYEFEIKKEKFYK